MAHDNPIHDNSSKRILARGCDPVMSAHAAKNIPPLLGNPSYVATTTDEEFFEKLAADPWSVIPIVETHDERMTVGLLREALAKR